MPAVPFKANAARRHRIPRQRHPGHQLGRVRRRPAPAGEPDRPVHGGGGRGLAGGAAHDPGGAALVLAPGDPDRPDLRAVFRLALRQTEGLIGSILRLLGLELAVPDHTTLSRRTATLEVPRSRSGSGGPLHLLVDSTGLELGGPGEWLVEKHGTRTRRAWRKLHLGVDAETGRIEAVELTT